MIKWGILGTGKMAATFTLALQNSPDCKVLAVGSRTLSNAEKFAQKYSISNAYGTYEELAQASDIDIIYIASTNNLHKNNAILSLNAGKHVLIEKPFALNAGEAEEVIALAKQKKLFCMEGMWMRFVPMIQKAQELVKAGEIGTVKMITANFGMPVHYAENNRQFDPKLGGGALLDLLVYPISLTQLLLGDPDKIQSLSTLSPTGVDEQTAAILGYKNGAIANIQASFASELANEVYIYGDKGSLHINAPIYRPHESHIKHFAAPVAESNQEVGGGGIGAKIKSNKLTRGILFKVGGMAKAILQKKVIVPFDGSGYEHEIAAVVQCLKNKQLESDIMPYEATLSIMQIMDTIREQQNINFPQEV